MGKNEQCNFSKGYDLDLKNFAAEQLAEKSTAVSPLQTEKKKRFATFLCSFLWNRL